MVATTRFGATVRLATSELARVHVRGEAMSWDHPLWGEADLPAGRKALAAMPHSGRLTPLEKGLIEAAQADFSSDDDDLRAAFAVNSFGGGQE